VGDRGGVGCLPGLGDGTDAGGFKYYSPPEDWLENKESMNRAYRVRVTNAAIHDRLLTKRGRADRLALIFLWSLATGVGVGAGWFIALTTGLPVLLGVPLGICQGLVLLPRWRRALLWAVATIAGWGVGLGFMFMVGPLVGGLVQSSTWVTSSGDFIGWAIALVPIFGVPAVAYAQWLVMRNWVRSEPFIFWWGVCVCSFPVAGAIGVVLLDPRNATGLIAGLSAVHPLAPGFWLIGTLWGLCTGWALSKTLEVAVTSRLRPVRQYR
jgi:hypothetical protein